jgi:hypothetical protein
MTPENLEKWFSHRIHLDCSEYVEVHVHSIITRNKAWEQRGMYIDILDQRSNQPQHTKVTFEIGISLRDPSDRLFGVRDTSLVLSENEIEEFKKDLLPLSEMAKVLYAKDKKDGSE